MSQNENIRIYNTFRASLRAIRDGDQSNPKYGPNHRSRAFFLTAETFKRSIVEIKTAVATVIAEKENRSVYDVLSDWDIQTAKNKAVWAARQIRRT